nr:MAG TPA: hypothetical protein [Bacteriophage sp.]
MLTIYNKSAIMYIEIRKRENSRHNYQMGFW